MEKQLDMSVLVALAGAAKQDEFTNNIPNMPEPLKKALQDQQAAQQQKVWEDAAKLILKIYKRADETIQSDVEYVRAARRKEAHHLAQIQKIKRAKAYGEATNNYLPLAVLVGDVSVFGETNTDKFLVPDDWVDPTQTTTQPKATAKPKRISIKPKV